MFGEQLSFFKPVGGQNATVLDHLQKKGSLTSLEAIGVYGIYRLASRVNDLRKAGYSIKSMMRRDARGKRYARYSMN